MGNMAFIINHPKRVLVGAVLLGFMGLAGFMVWNHLSGSPLPSSKQIVYGWLESPSRLRIFVDSCAVSPRVIVRETPDFVRLNASTYPIPCLGIESGMDPVEVGVQLQSPLGNRHVVDGAAGQVLHLQDRYRIEEIAPCTPVLHSSVDPCDSEAPSIDFSLGQPSLGDASPPSTVREMLDGDPLTWVTHLVVRGTYLPGTVRCTSGDPFRPLSILERRELPTTTTVRAFNCYVDIRVNAYLIGSGPPTITALLLKWQYPEGRKNESETSVAEQDIVEQHRLLWERHVHLAFSGREHVIFIGPSIDLSSALWRVASFWDVQRHEDGTVFAANLSRPLWAREGPDENHLQRPAPVVEMSALRKALQAAHQARVDEYDGRIGADASLPALVADAYKPWLFYGEAGAYPSGHTTNSKPAQRYPKAKRNESFSHTLFTLCGVQDTIFDGRHWIADPRIEYDENGYPPRGWEVPTTDGEIYLAKEDVANFRTQDDLGVRFVPSPPEVESEVIPCISGPPWSISVPPAAP